MTKEILLSLIEKNYTQKKIADELNLANSSVVYWLKKFNLKTNSAKSKRTSIVWKIPKEDLIKIVNECNSLADILRKLGYVNHLNSALYRPLRKRLKKDLIDHSHIQLGKNSNLNKDLTKHTKESYILKLETGSILKADKKQLIKFNLIPNDSCAICDQNRWWNNLPLTLHLDHIDGNPNNNKLDNLRFICPNCHTQTSTFCVGNRKPKEKNTCVDCSSVIGSGSIRCQSCASKLNNQKLKKFNPSEDELHDMVCVKRIPFVKLGEIYGASDNAVRKRCLSFGIDPKKRIKI